MYNEGIYSIYRIYLSYKRVNESNFSNPIQVSDDGVQYPHDYQGAFPIVGTDGTLYIFWSLENANHGYSSQILMKKSTDGGETFTSGQQVIKDVATNPEGLVLNGTFQKAHSWPYVTLNPSDGSLILVYADYPTLLYSRSTDDGVTWSESTEKGLKPAEISEVWNPNLCCDNNGKISVVYYATTGSADNTRIYVANGYASDNVFTIRSEGSVLFNPNTWKYSDYIGIASNDYTYWGVYPAPATNNNTQIIGMYRMINAKIENIDESYNPLYGTIKVDNIGHDSPFTTPDYYPGISHTLEIESNTIIRNGSVYQFSHWEDESGTSLGSTNQIIVNIDNHRYMAIFDYVPVTPVNVSVKNEFKDPDLEISHGGTVNIDYEDYFNTQSLPGQQVTLPFIPGEQHRFEAKAQTYPEEGMGSYYRGFNYYPEHDGGWVYPDGFRNYMAVVNPSVIEGVYNSKYRNRYDISVQGFAQELDQTIQLQSVPNIWQYESQLIFAPPMISFNNYYSSFFSWSSGESSNERIVSPLDNAVYTALYKIKQHSNSTEAYSSSSQRKFVRTRDGNLHYVYLSMGHIWYERSTDNGSTWNIMNDGKPLDNPELGTPTSPAIIDIYTEDDAVAICFFSYYNLVVQRYLNGIKKCEDYYSFLLPTGINPSIAFRSAGNDKILVVWQDYGALGYALWELGLSGGYTINFQSTGNIPNTDINSSNPSCVGTLSYYNNPDFHLVWQQGISQIKYCKLYVTNNEEITSADSAVFSAGSPLPFNRNPSISVA